MGINVSVIIPAYNAGKFIQQAIGSVLAQTYPGREIIVIDDGSMDNTREVLEPYKTDNLITYIYQQNAGPAAARNNGIRHSKGELIAFLDADDVWLRDKLEKQVALFKHPEVGLVYSRYNLLHCDGHEELVDVSSYRGKVVRHLIQNNFVANSSVVARRAALIGAGLFNESRSLYGLEDYDMWLRLSLEWKFDFIEKPLLCYRLHGGQISIASRPQTLKVMTWFYGRFLRDRRFVNFRGLLMWKFLQTFKARVWHALGLVR